MLNREQRRKLIKEGARLKVAPKRLKHEKRPMSPLETAFRKSERDRSKKAAEVKSGLL